MLRLQTDWESDLGLFLWALLISHCSQGPQLDRGYDLGLGSIDTGHCLGFGKSLTLPEMPFPHLENEGPEIVDG